MTDGYEAYAPVVREQALTHAGCWAHARRKFNDALKVQGTQAKGKAGKAMSYLDNQWDKLTCFLDDGLIPLDNNPAENAIRPFVIGRKAWLFADTVHGAVASANLYSLVETAKANGLEPYRYLRHVFTHLPAAQSPEEIDALLPTRVDAEMINAIPL